MSAVNVVRFRARPGLESKLIEAHRQADTSGLCGFRRGSLIRTGERTFCMVGEWEDFSAIEQSREAMIRVLDTFRDCLEDLGSGLGVTDPVSGEVVVEFGP